MLPINFTWAVWGQAMFKVTVVLAQELFCWASSIKRRAARFHFIMLSYINASWLIWSSPCNIMCFNWGTAKGVPINLSNNHAETPQSFLCFLCRVDYSNLYVSFVKGKYSCMGCTSVSGEQQTSVNIINIWSVIPFWGCFAETFSGGLRHCSSKTVRDETLPLKEHYSTAAVQKLIHC